MPPTRRRSPLVATLALLALALCAAPACTSAASDGAAGEVDEGGGGGGGAESDGITFTFGEPDAADAPPGDSADAAPDAAPSSDLLDASGGAAPDLPATPPDAAGGAEELPPPPDAFDPGGPCTQDCGGKVCGSDGCGGICGYCTYPLVCDSEGQCVDVCQQECDGRICGPDGCGGTCGECLEPLLCGEDGLCYEPDCVPNCVGKVCGPDLCGGDCGLCPSPKVCVNGGCALGPCGTVTGVGECQGDVAVWCIEQTQLVEDECDAYPEDHVCAYDGFANQYKCVLEGDCTPKCEGKKCGGDGCGGVCPPGCFEGWACVQGACDKEPGASCGPVTAVGQCEGSTLWFCANGKLYSVDCTTTGEGCSWSIDAASFECQ